MRIFVSSTFKDLRPERESAQEALRRSELVPWGMELFVSEPSKPLDVCLEQVQLSDAVILIIGFMAGSLIPESPELTYTRAEFELAQRLGRPVFAFFKTEGGVPVNKETDADKKKALDDFKNAVTSAGITPAYFDSPDRLTTELLLAVTNWNTQGRPGARRVFTTPKEFFAPFEWDAHRLFDFKQMIRGREEQLQGLSAFLADPTEIVGVLTGRGGIGKSKLLHDWVQTVGNRKVLYVMEDADWHANAAKEIPVGDLLIVADEINASQHSFFKHVIEQRAANESDPALHYWLKILANSGSYGLFVELNPKESGNAKLKVFSGEEAFETTSNIIEEPGKWFAPHIAALITAGGRLLLAMLERCITDAGGTYLLCDTDSAAIVSTKHRQTIPMPDGELPIAAVSWNEVDDIVQQFEHLNPYDHELIPGSILKVHRLNWGGDKRRRQLCGYGIAAKRYALYTKTHSDIEIVEPKAHGLGYFYPPKDSAKGWNHETPEWIFEAWNWLMRGVLGLKRKRPEWLDRPVMMKLTLSTPHHALKNLAKGPITRPNNFMMIPQISRFGYPQDVDPNKCTFITSFSSERHQWIHAKCINIHDHQSRIYELADEYDGRRAVPENFFTLMESYQNHPEAKSLGPDGKPCEFDTRGLLQRAHIVANWPPIYIGKESDRHWEEGDDLSLLEFRTIEYKRKGYVIANDKQLERITRVPKRELRRRGINQHTLEKICSKMPVRTTKLAHCLKVLEAAESQARISVANAPYRSKRLCAGR